MTRAGDGAPGRHSVDLTLLCDDCLWGHLMHSIVFQLWAGKMAPHAWSKQISQYVCSKNLRQYKLTTAV